MAKLNYIPDESSYSIEFPNELIYVPVEGGLPRVRRDIVGGSTLTDVTWSLTAAEYDTLLTFYRANKAVPFEIDLQIEGDLDEYSAKFVPNSFGLASHSGSTYIVKARLEILGTT